MRLSLETLIGDIPIIAKIFSISERQAYNLTKQGMPKVKAGQYHIPTCVAWFIDRKTDREGVDMHEQRKLLYAAQTEREELQNAVRRSELIELTEMQHVLNTLAVTFSSQLDAIGARLANDLVGVTDPAEIKERIDDETRQVRESVAGIVESWASAADDGGDTEAAA